MAKHEYYVVQGKTLDNVAETMKTVLGVDKDTPIRFDEITNNEKAEQVTESVDVQAQVIEQIKAALNGKSSVGVKEIMDIIDQSGVLDSTDGTATEKVEQLIEKADTLKKATHIGFANNNNITTVTVDCRNLTSLRDLTASCKNLKTVYICNTQNVKDWYFAFCANGVTHIYGDMDMSSASNVINAFYTFNLIHARFVKETIYKSMPVTSKYLDNDTIQSIIDGLATVETAQTLTLDATVKAKLTEEQLATITSKNWSVA